MTTQGRIIYFHHIPKTAGSSVRVWLDPHFGSGLCPAGIADELVTIPSGELERYSVFAGHFHGYLAAYLRREVVAFTVLRDPLARTRSHWHEVRRASKHPDHARVRGQGFAEFVQDDRNRIMIEDYQARYLIGLPFDMQKMARRLSADELSRFALADALERVSLNVAKPILAAGARETLNSMVAVGTCERLGAFIAEVGRILDIPPPAEVPRANVTERDEAAALPASALARLRELTRIDQDLYDAALETAAHAGKLF